MLLYNVTTGRVAQHIAQQALRCGQPLPESVTKAPVLRAGLDLYLQAFFDLCGERAPGLTIMPIPWSAMYHYGQAYTLSDEQLDDMIYLVRQMDEAYIDKVRPKDGNAT